VVAELASLEAGLRAEIGRLSVVERTLGEWRTALAGNGSAAEGQLPARES
jgi:hypothetical protein